MSDAESEEVKEEEEQDYDDETEEEYDSENESELHDVAVSELPGGNDGKSTITRRTKKKGASSRMSDGMDIQYRFNALRFLAMNLKSQNETMKPRTAGGGDTPPSSTGIGNMKGGATFWLKNFNLR